MDIKRLHYRRQFLLSRAPINLLAEWQSLNIDEYYLYVHPDLEVNRAADEKKSIVLIGSIFDSEVPEKRNADIINDILVCTNGPEELFLKIKQYAGRYALIYKSDKDAIILNDALGLREIYYCTSYNDVVCGSQPNLVAKFATPEIKKTSDPDLLEFYRTHLVDSRWSPLCKWIGDETYFESVKHLLPNHYLDINKRHLGRYWPNEPIKRIDLNEAVSKICRFLQGIMRAIVHRHEAMVAVTSGTDSRTLLAASRQVKDQIYFFINNQGLGHDHPDIAVPRNMCANLDIPFHIHEVPNEVDEEFRQIFLNNTFYSTERILPTIFNVYFKNHGEKVNLLGIGEIGRTRYGEVPKNLNSYRMAYKLGYKNSNYAIRQSENILAELLPVGREYGLNVLTLLYWEHTMGNWGTIGNSESDIAIEELDPYDSHMLYEIFLGIDGRYTKYNNPLVFKEIIRYMWPELLEWPLSPPYKGRDKIVGFLKKVEIGWFLKELKYQMYYFRYFIKSRL